MNHPPYKLKLDPKTVFRLLTDDGTLATTLQIIALAAYGPEIYQVDAMEVVLELESQFNCRMTEDVENRLKAILLATCTDIFFEDPDAFVSIGNTLVNGDPGLNQLDPLTIPEALWSIFEVELNHGPRELLPPVQNVLDRVLEGEMTDSEGTPVEGDPYQYAWDFAQALHTRLKHQLTELGVPGEYLPPIHTPTLLHEAQIA